jgi:2-polyprenyl-6-methoxyphenol hydroxylase-like FAD-dependent oxidoreductase
VTPTANEARPDVLIVGAGPVGMVLACELLQRGVRVRIVDRIAEVDHAAARGAAGANADPHSRAILLVPRVLELLRRVGVADELVRAGTPVSSIRYCSAGRPVGTVAFSELADTDFKYVLALPQRETERVLRRRLAELGGVVERGVALEELGDPRRPRVRLRHPDGAVEEVTPGWLVGADGAASTTRKLLGVRLEGDPTDVTYVIADAPLTGPVPAGAQYYYSDDGLLAVIPMRDGLYRIAGNVPHDTAQTEPRWQELLQAAVDARARAPLRVGPPEYARLVRPRCGRATRFRVGRCFLVGDAAHVITPAGGQGMNLGVQDAVNLGWKLAAVVRDGLAESVLDTYEPERREAAIRMSATTARIIGLARPRGPLRVALRDAAVRGADRVGLVQRALARLLSQLDVDYGSRGPLRRGLIRRGPWRGQRVPPGATSLAEGGYTALLWPGRRVPRNWAGTSARLRAALGGQVAVRDLGERPPAAASRLRRLLGPASVVAIVRPDGHLAHVARVRDVDATVAFVTGLSA